MAFLYSQVLRLPFQKNAFSLAEALITLGLLAVIAIFTLPKLMFNNPSNYNVIAKEDIAALSQAFTQLKLSKTIKPNTSSVEIISKLNHLGQTTNNVHDTLPTIASVGSCTSPPEYCYLMSNGSMIYVTDNFQFRQNATDPINDGNNYALIFGIDPNVSRSTTFTNGPEKALNIYIYYDGLIRSLGTVLPKTTYYSPTLGQAAPSPDPTPAYYSQYDPQWFSW